MSAVLISSSGSSADTADNAASVSRRQQDSGSARRCNGSASTLAMKTTHPNDNGGNMVTTTTTSTKTASQPAVAANGFSFSFPTSSSHETVAPSRPTTHSSLKSTSHGSMRLKRRRNFLNIQSLRKNRRNEKLKRLRETDSPLGGSAGTSGLHTIPQSSTNMNHQNTTEMMNICTTPTTQNNTFPQFSTDVDDGQYTLNLTSNLIQQFMGSSCIEQAHKSMKQLRILVSLTKGRSESETKSIFDQLTTSQQFLHVLFQRMVQYTEADAQHEQSLEFVYEALWFLTNVVGGDHAHCMRVISAGALQSIAHILRVAGNRFPLKTLDLFIWMIANVSVESPKDILKHSLHKVLELLLSKQISEGSVEDWSCSSIFDHTLWAIHSLLKGLDTMEEQVQLEGCIRLLVHVFLTSNEEDLLSDVGAIFVDFTKNFDDLLELFLKMDDRVAPRLLSLMIQHSQSLFSRGESRTIAKVCLKLVSCLSASSHVQHCQLLIDAQGSMNAFMRFFAVRDESVKRELAFTLSNILAGTSSQVDAVIHFDTDGPLIRELVKLFWTSSRDVQKECAIAITNAWICASEESKQILVEKLNTVPVLIQALKWRDLGVVNCCLDAVKSILETGSFLEGFVNPYTEMLEDERGDEVLSQIYYQVKNEEIHGKVEFILTEYFDHCGL